MYSLVKFTASLRPLDKGFKTGIFAYLAIYYYRAPWGDVWKWYSPWVEHVRHRSELYR